MLGIHMRLLTRYPPLIPSEKHKESKEGHDRLVRKASVQGLLTESLTVMELTCH